MPIKVKIKTNIDVNAKRVPNYMCESEFIVIDYPNENETTIMYSDNYVYTFKNEDIEKA